MSGRDGRKGRVGNYREKSGEGTGRDGRKGVWGRDGMEGGGGKWY